MFPGPEHPPPPLCSEPGELERPGGGPALLPQPRPQLQGRPQLQEEPGALRADLQRGQRQQDLCCLLPRLQGGHGRDPRHRPEDQLCLHGHSRGLQGALRVYRVPEAVLGQPVCRSVSQSILTWQNYQVNIFLCNCWPGLSSLVLPLLTRCSVCRECEAQIFLQMVLSQLFAIRPQCFYH